MECRFRSNAASNELLPPEAETETKDAIYLQDNIASASSALTQPRLACGIIIPRIGDTRVYSGLISCGKSTGACTASAQFLDCRECSSGDGKDFLVGDGGKFGGYVGRGEKGRGGEGGEECQESERREGLHFGGLR